MISQPSSILVGIIEGSKAFAAASFILHNFSFDNLCGQASFLLASIATIYIIIT